VVICLERGADCLDMVQLMPLHSKAPSSLALFKSRLVYFSGTGLPRLPWKRGRQMGVVVVVVPITSYQSRLLTRCIGPVTDEYIMCNDFLCDVTYYFDDREHRICNS